MTENRNDKINRIITNGKIIQPPTSPTLKLDSLLKGRKESEECFQFKDLKNFTELSIQDNDLTQLPLKLAENLSSNLVKINLSNNNLVEIDASFKLLTNLQQLIVDKNRLEELPNFIGELINLRLFSAKGNKLVDVPQNLANLANLEEIDLRENKIKDVHESLAKLDHVRILRLSHNQLRVVPKCLITGLKKLEVLHLSHNFISEFNTPLLSKNLRILFLNNNSKNQQFPVWLLRERLLNLEELILDETFFNSFDIPEELPVSPLRKLSMVRCGISDTIFGRICRSMINLDYVNLSNDMPNIKGNVFWVIPVRSFGNPERLTELNIQDVGLPAVPQEINVLRNLNKLNISRNNISCLPDEICELKNLQLLNAAHNNLYALPDSIGNLTNLNILILETNRLSSLPDSIERLTLLEFLDLYNNEFLQVPEQLGNIPSLKALDIDGNAFEPEKSEVIKIGYLEARNNLRSTSSLLCLRSNDQKVFDETDDDAPPKNYYEYEEDLCSEENKSVKDLTLSDINSEENWDISEDSADEFDPTEKPKTCLVYSPFTVSSVFYYGNFCPADLHNTRVKDQLAAMEPRKEVSSRIEDGQFDDA